MAMLAMFLGCNIGVLILNKLEKGLGVYYILIIIRNPQNSTGNCEGPQISCCGPCEDALWVQRPRTQLLQFITASCITTVDDIYPALP